MFGLPEHTGLTNTINALSQPSLLKTQGRPSFDRSVSVILHHSLHRAGKAFSSFQSCRAGIQSWVSSHHIAFFPDQQPAVHLIKLKL